MTTLYNFHNTNNNYITNEKKMFAKFLKIFGADWFNNEKDQLEEVGPTGCSSSSSDILYEGLFWWLCEEIHAIYFSLFLIFAIPILFTIWLYNWKLNFGKLEFGYSGNFYDKLPNSKSITPPLKSCCRVPVFMMKNSNLYWLRWNRQFIILSRKIWLDSSHSKMM